MRLNRLSVGIVLLVMMSFPIVCLGDDPCPVNDVVGFTSSLPDLAPSDQSGQFKVQSLVESTKFKIAFVNSGKVVFSKVIENQDGALAAEPVTNRGTALFLNYVYGNGGVQYPFLIFPKAGRFQVLRIGGYARIEDLNKDGMDEIVSMEFQNWTSGCSLSHADEPRKTLIYHLDSQAGKLIDVSGQFPAFYSSQITSYTELYRTTNSEFSPECRSGFQSLMEYARAMAGEAATPKEDDVVELTADVTKPQIMKRVNPIFPAQSSRGIQGTVIVALLISETGQVVNSKILRGLNDDFNQAALAAVNQWQFRPAMKNGQPVKVWVTYPVVFRVQ